MPSLSRLGAAALTVAALSSGVAAIPKITRAGRYLFDDSGDRFYIKGVAYQPQGEVIASANNAFGEPSTFIDPLANSTACSRDLPVLQQLGVNTVRVYSVNASLDHDDCMSALSGANIYTIIDLSLPNNGSMDRDTPAWSTNLQDLYLSTIDTFSKYDNVLAYNVGNEVVIAANGTGTAAFLKAAARDVKAFLKSKNLNTLVGYASIDGDPTWRDPLANYLSASADDISIDIYGLNNYEWCGDSTFQASYAGTEGDYAGYNIPAYFSEFGCLNPTGSARPFTEVAALLSGNMSDVWSGGVAFSYFPASSAAGQFGMVTLSADESTVSTSTDFNNLKQQFSSATPPNTPSQSSAGSTNFPAFPTQNDTFLASSTLPGTPVDSGCSCIANALSCQYHPSTPNDTVVVGELINTACGLLANAGSNCDEIAGNGTSGVYGDVASCDPRTKTSFVMSKFYESQSRNAQACSFSGNGTVNTRASTASGAAQSAASSCISSPTGTSVPSAPPSVTAAAASGSSHTTSSGSGGSGSKSAAVSDVSLRGVAIVMMLGALGGMWTLA